MFETIFSGIENFNVLYVALLAVIPMGKKAIRFLKKRFESQHTLGHNLAV